MTRDDVRSQFPGALPAFLRWLNDDPGIVHPPFTRIPERWTFEKDADGLYARAHDLTPIEPRWRDGAWSVPDEATVVFIDWHRSNRDATPEEAFLAGWKFAKEGY